MFDVSDPHSFIGSLTPIQGLPGAAQLDMNVSCLFMHEVKNRFFFKFKKSVFFSLSFSYDININMENMKI